MNDEIREFALSCVKQAQERRKEDLAAGRDYAVAYWDGQITALKLILEASTRTKS